MQQPPIRPDKVRDLRIERQLSQQDLAVLAELSLGQINRIENGRIEHPQFRTLRKLARALGVEAAELLDDTASNGDGSS